MDGNISGPLIIGGISLPAVLLGAWGAIKAIALYVAKERERAIEDARTREAELKALLEAERAEKTAMGNKLNELYALLFEIQGTVEIDEYYRERLAHLIVSRTGTE